MNEQKINDTLTKARREVYRLTQLAKNAPLNANLASYYNRIAELEEAIGKLEKALITPASMDTNKPKQFKKRKSVRGKGIPKSQAKGFSHFEHMQYSKSSGTVGRKGRNRNKVMGMDGKPTSVKTKGAM